MTSFVSRLATSTAVVLAIAGCAATPATHLHTLVPADTGPARMAAGPSLLLGAITVPVAVDEPRWLIRMPDGSLSRLENERWASSLPDELRAAVLQVLAARHGVVDARSPGAPAAQWRAQIDVTRFDTASDGDVVEEGVWALSAAAGGNGSVPRDNGALRCSFAWRENAGTGAAALAEAHRRAVARLGDALGAAVVAATRGQAPACPG
jgi:uncharacterized lipoprotein YmbA